jgi:hypothetical protein
LISCTFCAEFAFFTTCQSATAANKITTQKMIVLTVEFTEKLLRTAALPVPSSRQGCASAGAAEAHLSFRLDARSGIWID